jgi:arsenite methyltransferase
MDEKKTKNFVKETYSAIAQTESSCCSCCGEMIDFSAIGKKIGYSENDLKNLPEAANMGLGCGNPVALASLKEGETVLDLGSGAGIDVFLAAKKVGSAGKAIGVDMTQAMVDRAKANAVDYGYKNAEFRLGEIEKMPIDDNSVDVIISNCVINLSTDKDQVFREAYRVLKNGGRLMVSDLVTEGELPDEVKQSLDAWACCIGGALEKQKYLESIRKAGFKDVKIASEATYDFDVAKELDGKIKSIHVEAYKK